MREIGVPLARGCLVCCFTRCSANVGKRRRGDLCNCCHVGRMELEVSGVTFSVAARFGSKSATCGTVVEQFGRSLYGYPLTFRTMASVHHKASCATTIYSYVYGRQGSCRTNW